MFALIGFLLLGRIKKLGSERDCERSWVNRHEASDPSTLGLCAHGIMEMHGL